MQKKLFEDIQAAILDFDEDELMKLTERVKTEKIDLVVAIEEGYTQGIKKIGELFETGEIFLPELVMAGQMVKDAVTSLEALISGSGRQKKGKVLMGTVEGDIHDIGKDLVIMMLSSRDLEVIDIGVDCHVDKLIDKALEIKADIIGVSCLLTMTTPEIKKLIDTLKDRGLREQFKVMAGGAAVSKQLADEFGADGYAADLKQSVDVAYSLLGVK